LSKRPTAADLLRKLNENPAFVAQQERKRQAQKQVADTLKADEAQLVAELRAAGYAVASVWDLVNTSARYDSALPILAEHLRRTHAPQIREGIARAMAVFTAAPWLDLLIESYLQESHPATRGGFAAAIAVACPDQELHKIIRLLRDPANGETRLLLLYALKRPANRDAANALDEFAADPVLSREVKLLRRKMREST
jgi:hypothetical protein